MPLEHAKKPDLPAKASPKAEQAPAPHAKTRAGGPPPKEPGLTKPGAQQPRNPPAPTGKVPVKVEVDGIGILDSKSIKLHGDDGMRSGLIEVLATPNGALVAKWEEEKARLAMLTDPANIGFAMYANETHLAKVTFADGTFVDFRNVVIRMYPKETAAVPKVDGKAGGAATPAVPELVDIDLMFDGFKESDPNIASPTGRNGW